MSVNPNPQGKGLVPVLDSLADCRARIAVPPKHIEQVSNELFTSLFVLNSQFHFRPVVGRRYWLYRLGSGFKLSMISPSEWGSSSFGHFVGVCCLQDDVTWTLELGEEAVGDESLLAMIVEKRNEFERALQAVESMQDALPVYLEKLPFYQRVLASTLANSLRTSMQLSGIAALSFEKAQEMTALPTTSCQSARTATRTAGADTAAGS